MTTRDRKKYRRRSGIEKLRTYIFAFESGAGLRAVGWSEAGRTRAESWDRPSRPRSAPSVEAEKRRYDAAI